MREKALYLFSWTDLLKYAELSQARGLGDYLLLGKVGISPR